MPEDARIPKDTGMHGDTGTWQAGMSYRELSHTVDLLLDRVDEDTDALVKSWITFPGNSR